MTQTYPGGRKMARVAWWTAAVVTIAAAIVPAVLWVGDIGFMQDEPRLLAKAYHANAAGAIETKGLNGNFGVPYGPLPTHIYQILLLITHDPVRIAGMRAALCAGVTAIGLIWLSRSLRLNPWFATAIVLAPYVWNFQRLMWDASFAIPIGTLAMAAYASHLRTSSGKSFLLCLACITALLFIHPQDLPVVAAIGGHVLWRRRAMLARHYIGVAVILGITLALNWSYFREVYYAVDWHIRHHTLKTTYAIEPPPRVQAFGSPLLSGALFSGKRFAEQDSRLSDPPGLVLAAKLGSLVAFPLIVFGISVTLATWLVRRRHPPGNDDLDDATDPTVGAARRGIFGIALAGFACQVLLYGAMRIPPEPQYFFGSFVLHVMLASATIHVLRRAHLDWPMIAIYAFSGGFITIASLIHIHRTGYDRAFPRPSLANQVQVARELNQYADPVVVTDVDQYKAHPQGIRTLRLLVTPDSAEPQAPGKRLMIRYRSGPSGADAAIELVEIPPGVDAGPRFAPLDVTPLPPNWQPANW